MHCVKDHGILDNLFLSVLPLSGITTGQDIYTDIIDFLMFNDTDILRLVFVVTNGAPSTVGKKKDLPVF